MKGAELYLCFFVSLCRWISNNFAFISILQYKHEAFDECSGTGFIQLNSTSHSFLYLMFVYW